MNPKPEPTTRLPNRTELNLNLRFGSEVQGSNPGSEPNSGHTTSVVLKIRDGEGADAETVLRDLPDHPWVHFACHGTLDTESPFKSGFVLHNKERLSLRNIMQARLPNAELAFLASCHSAAITPNIPDEALSLSAAMQFCGFRLIVGTLWAMNDGDGPVLADAFYKHMIQDGLDNTDVRDSAEAVHVTTKPMREAGVPLHWWMTFVHLGV